MDLHPETIILKNRNLEVITLDKIDENTYVWQSETRVIAMKIDNEKDTLSIVEKKL